jgi:hypothetical protein
MIKTEAAKFKAKLGMGEKWQTQKAALVGVRDTVEAKPRSPEALAKRLVEPEAARARPQRTGTIDGARRAQPVRRMASLVWTKPAVMELSKADAERRDAHQSKPLGVWLDGARGRWNLASQLCQPWQRMTPVRALMHVVSSPWTAANAWFHAGTRVGKPWGQERLTAILSGRVDYVSGGLRQVRPKRKLRQSV